VHHWCTVLSHGSDSYNHCLWSLTKHKLTKQIHNSHLVAVRHLCGELPGVDTTQPSPEETPHTTVHAAHLGCCRYISTVAAPLAAHTLAVVTLVYLYIAKKSPCCLKCVWVVFFYITQMISLKYADYRWSTICAPCLHMAIPNIVTACEF
jgi:hypothetical protein